MLEGAASLAATVLGASSVLAQPSDATARARPEPGDRLVLATADNETRPIRLGDLEIGGKPLLAWAMQPDSKRQPFPTA